MSLEVAFKTGKSLHWSDGQRETVPDHWTGNRKGSVSEHGDSMEVGCGQFISPGCMEVGWGQFVSPGCMEVGCGQFASPGCLVLTVKRTVFVCIGHVWSWQRSSGEGGGVCTEVYGEFICCVWSARSGLSLWWVFCSALVLCNFKAAVVWMKNVGRFYRVIFVHTKLTQNVGIGWRGRHQFINLLCSDLSAD